MSNIALLGDAGMLVWAYRMAPQFWKRYSADRKRAILDPSRRPRPNEWSDSGIHAAWIGHSTVLMKIEGTTILTDPVFSARIGLNLGLLTLGVKRLVAPALAISELPKIDLVLLSHAHFDHFDLPSLRALANRGTTVITAAKTADLLRPRRYARVHELAWDERVSVGPLEIRAFRVRHWGARMRNDVYRGYNGYIIETRQYRVIFGGDTAFTDAFKGLRSSRACDLAIMPVGAYDPWIRYRCTPEQAWQMANEAGAAFILPVHHQTFQLSSEPLLEPIERLLESAGGNPERVAVERIGDEFHWSRD
jgi:L-ascorbate metabolism protein UlaG (beta-lactamase superfamily)